MPQQRPEMIIAKVSHYLFEETIETITKETDSFMMSVTAVQADCTCKLLRLIPGRCMVRLIMELVGNRSFTLTKSKQVTTFQERRPTGICPGTPSLRYLYL